MKKGKRGNIKMSEVVLKAQKAKESSRILAALSTETKNNALLTIANFLVKNNRFLIEENKKDIMSGEKNGLNKSLLDRLMLNEKRIADMADGLQAVVALPDPVGNLLDSWERPNGLKINKVSVPLGVIGMIYEARPNVTVDAAGLAIKTGNSVVLRGSSSAVNSNIAIVKVIKDALMQTEVSADSVQLIEDTNRETALQMLKLNQYLDVLIPRGGSQLIQYVVNNASVPVLETGAGNCHVYIDKDADLNMAIQITINSKTQRPSVCNAAETLLVDKEWANSNLAKLIKELEDKNVECRGCENTLQLVPHIVKANKKDWETEYLDYIMAVKIVEDVEEAINHINKYGTKHSEVIVSETLGNVDRFLKSVDAAAVYHNASSRFTDGFEYGFGAEIGISTQKLHARGPMGLPALTSYKYIIYGKGQIR